MGNLDLLNFDMEKLIVIDYSDCSVNFYMKSEEETVQNVLQKYNRKENNCSYMICDFFKVNWNL